MAPLSAAEVDNLLRPLLLKDLRIQCRARGVSPAGSLEVLRDRLKQDMLSSGDFALKSEDGSDLATVTVVAGVSSAEQAGGKLQNNYQRSAGQNVGNFISDRPSSRVLAAPGGASQIVFGDAEPVAAKATGRAAVPGATAAAQEAVNPITGASSAASGQIGTKNNNYARPAGQNVGNFLTDRNSSRVLAPPGGKSQITFG